MQIQQYHPSLFMVDLESVTGRQENVQDYVLREPGYDIAFCLAWKEAVTLRKAPPHDAKSFLAHIDAIQKCALAHLPAIKTCKEGFYKIQGRADVNFYGLYPFLLSNEQGIKEIIEKIWLRNANFELISHVDESSHRYLLTKSEFCEVFANKTVQQIFENTQHSQEVAERISEILIPLYRKGLLSKGSDRMAIYHTTCAVEREKEILKIIDHYLQSIQSLTSAEKTRLIAITIRDLMQQHPYYDGNGRTFYILANLLLAQNDLPLFYPRNMCLFDGNCIDTIVQEITVGQERFAQMFESFDSLTEGLDQYHRAVHSLYEAITRHFTGSEALQKSFNARNFSLMLRQTAADEKAFPLLTFMLQNAKVLNIDLFAKGATSGNALDVAARKGNTKAASILSQYGLAPTLA